MFGESEAPADVPSPFSNLLDIPIPLPVACPYVNALGDPRRLPPETAAFLTAAKACRDKVCPHALPPFPFSVCVPSSTRLCV